ncbi:MAG: alpha/beta hydrolase [Pseudomonadales bacterium]|nr:alpha/beta hydrolase [Pseudomonadales bacterium]MBO6565824.1 alpha/beta hydrolase [Pseudomonadales bacterium]MBO6595515.1 alpha/beta hydrolase [Pseudomonadales bacterium]MBO6657077.1 alpha/beta hydrolase [Pseudomonadales bacterium]MBO6702015.1 alpha/beta hydrolase [Pseudomonadales bacterium]
MLLDYDRIDPELRPALDSFPGFEINRENVLQVREMMDGMRVEPEVEVLSDKTSISTPDGNLDIYIFRKNDRPNQPAVLWIHGGGYIMGSADDVRAKVFAHDCDCTVFSVDYRMAPEHPFPAGPEDCYAALSWLMNNDDDLGIDSSKVVLGGASAGAGMAAGVALMNRDRENFPLTLQLLLYPMIDNLHATGSGEITNHAVWNLPTSVNAWEMYLDGTPDLDASPYAAATRARDLSGLPATYICVGTEDLFRDEDIDYARRVSEAGVPCELAVFPGMYHAGESFVPNAAVSQRMNQSILSALTHALS